MSTLRILVTDGMEKAAVGKLNDLGYEVIEQFYDQDALKEVVKEVDVLVVRSATKVRAPIIDAAAEGGRLKLIIRGGVGIDNIDDVAARAHGIEVMNTPNASSASVAELVLGHIFSVARNIGIANVTMREGKWEKNAYKGTELAGKRIGLIGMGRIGKEIAQRARALGMHIVYTNRTGHKKAYDPYIYKEIDELLRTSDYVSLHLPPLEDGSALVDAAFIEKMKDGAVLINTARGSLVDEDALLAALNSGKLSGAGLDVFKDEPTNNIALVSHAKVSATPHIGGSTIGAQLRIGDEIVAIIKEKFEG